MFFMYLYVFSIAASYLVNRNPHGNVSTLRINKLLQESLMRMCDYKNPGMRIQYACIILMTKFASRALYAVPRVCVQSQVYFGLNTQIFFFFIIIKKEWMNE